MSTDDQARCYFRTRLDRLIAEGRVSAPRRSGKLPEPLEMAGIRMPSVGRSPKFATSADPVPLLSTNSSALVKLVRREPQTGALRVELEGAI